MCGRFTNKLTWDEIVRLYRLTMKAPPHNLPPRYNLCPTDPVDVVTEREGSRDFVRMRWGLVPSWWPKSEKDLKAATFNARAETVADKPFFREAFRRTRCLIPASGYYEWQDTATGKQPWYFTRADGEPMTFAGLWDEWKDKTTGEVVKSCTMLITEPNDLIAELHDRMPVVLESKDFLMVSRAAAVEYAQDGIRVNSIHPGLIDTPMTETLPPLWKASLLDATPMKRSASADEVARAALFLVSDDASFITGTQLIVDGGLTAV
jgi:putative SOS response-associated peptidase YedK